MEMRAANRYSVSMTELERNILTALTDLEAAVRTMSAVRSKPDLMPLFRRIEELAGQLPRGTAPDLLHYLNRKSYEKARQWLEGRSAEIQTGGCTR